MANRHWTVIILWLLIFSLLELFPFSAALSWINNIHFVLVYVLVCAYFVQDWRSFAVALAGGIIFDAVAPVPCHTLLFVLLVFAMRLLRRMFYTQDSAMHKISCFIPLALAEIYLFYLLNGSPTNVFTIAAYLAVRSAADFLVFIVFLIIFRERGRMIMYKM